MGWMCWYRTRMELNEILIYRDQTVPTSGHMPMDSAFFDTLIRRFEDLL